MRVLLPLLLLVAACASGPAGEADLTAELAGRTAGPARDCVPTSTGAGLVARDSQTLVYRQGVKGPSRQAGPGMLCPASTPRTRSPRQYGPPCTSTIRGLRGWTPGQAAARRLTQRVAPWR